jgi:methionyl aminopeptidase
LIVRKSKSELEAMREGGKITGACLKLIAKNARPGVTTGELDRLAEEFIREHGGTPEFKGYPGSPGNSNFPGSICASPNAMIVHGIPGSYRLKDGDIISLDVGVRYEGFVTDSATTVAVGEVPEATQDLLKTTRQCLLAAAGQVRLGKRLGDIGNAIQTLAESRGYSVVRDLVSHGVGRKMHEDPQIPNYGRPGTGPRLQPGMTFAIEPMITQGSYDIRVSEWDGWSIYTADNSLSAHFEHTIAVTENGPWVLTQAEPNGEGSGVGGTGGAW